MAELPPATGSTVLLRYLSVRPGKVLKPDRDWRDPQIYSYPLATLLMPGSQGAVSLVVPKGPHRGNSISVG